MQHVADLKEALAESYLDGELYENALPEGQLIQLLNQTTGQVEYRRVTSNGSVQPYPRLGAFEIEFQGHVLFSKLKTGVWPSAKLIIEKVAKVKDNLEEGKRWNDGLPEAKQSAAIEKREELPHAKPQVNLSEIFSDKRAALNQDMAHVSAVVPQPYEEQEERKDAFPMKQRPQSETRPWRSKQIYNMKQIDEQREKERKHKEEIWNKANANIR